jgi:hypothetical protein
MKKLKFVSELVGGGVGEFKKQTNGLTDQPSNDIYHYKGGNFAGYNIIIIR